MDWQVARVETVPKALTDLVRREGIRVNGQPLAGGRPSRPLSNGDRIQMGGTELLWIAPRPGFRLALIRAEAPRVEAADDAGHLERDLRRRPDDLADLFSNAEIRTPRQVIPPELLARYREIYPAPLLRLPDLVYEAEGGTRILLSPRLKGGDPIPVGTNPGPGGIYLHGAWNPRARRYEIPGTDVEFFLLQDGDAYLFQAAPRSGNEAPVRLLRTEETAPSRGRTLRELPLAPEGRIELQDGDVIEFGPAGQRTRLHWFRNLDAPGRA